MFSICKSDLTLSFMTEANDIPVAEDDLNTTAPNPKPDVWRMPEPVFRRTSGRLPQNFQKNYGSPSEGSEPAAADIDPPAVVADAENGESSTAHLQSKPKHPTVKLILVLLGLAAMIGFIVVFLTVVYFYFFR